MDGGLHPEWDLMYSQGLTVRRIAELCGAVKGTVDRHIRIQKQLDPNLQANHEKNVPPVTSRPLTALWLANLESMKHFREQHGRYPTSKNPDHEARRLARWLTDQRARLKAGTLSNQKQEHMAVLPDWEASQRPRIDAERWQQRLDQLIIFMAEHQRWPRHRNFDSENQRVLGVWLHSRRQEASRRTLPKNREAALDEAVPGWNTWKA